MSTTETAERRWYFVHTYSGQEDRVKKNLQLRIESMDMGSKIFQVEVPSEEIIEIKEGKRVPKRVRLYPGYIMVEMVMDDESWYVVRNTPGVTGFVSAEDERDKRPKPVPLEAWEADKILQQMHSERPKTRVGFTKGESVRIVDGPFTEFIGVVDTIDQDRSKVIVLVSFFGRETPVELDFLQVSKL
ncbi:MAG: transcription termination/antitermination factor NusG [Chloroflexi bacterium]|nr:transcription termination/antitermination factor NusG [Chloroflexota bacterium]